MSQDKSLDKNVGISASLIILISFLSMLISLLAMLVTFNSNLSWETEINLLLSINGSYTIMLILIKNGFIDVMKIRQTTFSFVKKVFGWKGGKEQNEM